MNDRYAPAIVNLVAILILVVLAFSVFVGSMTRSVDCREQMHGGGSVLLPRGDRLYKDFSYVGMPCYPLLISSLFRMTGTGHYLLVGRIPSVVAGVLVVLSIFGIYRRVFGRYRIEGTLLGLAAVSLYVFNPFVYNYSGSMSSRDIVISCVVVSFWLFVSTDFGKRGKYWRTALMGVLLSIASLTEFVAVLFHVLFLVFLVMQPASGVKERLKNVAAFLIATVVVSAWPIWVIAQAPGAFWTNTYRLGAIERLLYRKHEPIFGKCEIMLLSLTLPGGVLLFVVALGLAFLLLGSRRQMRVSQVTGVLLAAFVVLVVFAIALAVPTMTLWEVAMLVPFVIICFAYPLLWLREAGTQICPPRGFKFASAVVTGCVVAGLIASPLPLLRLPRLFTPGQWVPFTFHSVAKDVGQKSKPPKRILTLHPLYALEGGAEIYIELSAGAAGYMNAGRLTASEREIAHLAGRKNIRELAEQYPPSAVLFDRNFRVLTCKYPLTAVVRPDLNMRKYDRLVWERVKHKNGVVVYYRR